MERLWGPKIKVQNLLKGLLNKWSDFEHTLGNDAPLYLMANA